MSTIKREILANGMPLVLVPIAGTRVVAEMIAFPAGARFEHQHENGIAHFLEHLVFKGGTKFDSAQKVNYRAEELGASMNAFTSHDLVAFHITSRAENSSDTFDLLTDMLARPIIPEDELDKERGVVIQEINMYDDQPSSVAFHLVDEAAYGGHPLGRPILGPAEHIRNFSKQEIMDFRERTWTPAESGIVLAGAVDKVDLDAIRELAGRFELTGPTFPAEAAPSLTAKKLIKHKDSEQSHLCLQWQPQIDASDPEQRAAFTVFTGLLGGSMGSRLFEEIREERGLCYSISARSYYHHDAVTMNIYGGLESKALAEAHEQILAIVDDLRTNGPTEEQVHRAKAYLAGSMVRALESSNSVATSTTRQLLLHQQLIEPDQLVANIDAVSYDAVKEMAAALTGDPAIGLVGPHDADVLG